LIKNVVLEFLQAEKIVISEACIWLATGSASMMENEVLSPDTIVICPKWSLLDAECKRKSLRQPVNLYAWSRDDAITKIVSCHLTKRLRDLNHPHDLMSFPPFEDLNS
jgi:hypothetical protein